MRKLLIILIGATLFGCSEELTQAPSDKLPSAAAIQTVTDLGYAVNGVYSVMVDRGSYAGDFGLYADAKGGEVVNTDSYNQFAPVIRLQTDKNATFTTSSYYDIYVGIARINDILSVYDNVTTGSDALETQKKDLKGQLLALRALFHFDAARLYAKLPTTVADINAANSGIVISNQKYPVSAKFKRSTLKETYDFIIADLLAAKDLISASKNLGKFNKYAVSALLSRVYLYMGDNNNALKYAEDVITNSPYRLYTTANYETVWAQEGTDEAILELRTTDLTSAQRNSIGYYTSPDGYAEASMTDEFVAFIQQDPNDVRANLIKHYGASDGSELAWWPMKYTGRAGVTSPLYVNNPKLIRLSEMYLIAAEALVKGATTTSGKDALYYFNELRKNRIKANFVPATSVNLDNILDERRKEFFCENQRMFDLVRNKKNIPSNPYFNDPIKYDDFKILTAIPQRELDINPEMTQNTGY